MKRTHFIIVIFFSLILLCLTSCRQQTEKQPEHTHKWEPANCTRGELCWSCKETRGEALGHTWVDATCAKAKHCSRCGKTEGNALPHISDGNGACAVCKQELSSRVLLDGASPENKLIVYDGAVLSFPFLEAAGVADRKPYSGRFGKEYRIYDQVGTLVVQGEWVQEYYNTTKTDAGWYSNYYHDTDYIPLSPGVYRVEYSYYKNYKAKYKNGLSYVWDVCMVPNDELLESYNIVEVR